MNMDPGVIDPTVKGGYLDFAHLTKLKNIYITEINMKKTIQINN